MALLIYRKEMASEIFLDQLRGILLKYSFSSNSQNKKKGNSLVLYPKRAFSRLISVGIKIF